MIFLHSHKLDIYFIFLGASASKKHTIYTVYMIKIILSYTCITAFSRLDFYGLLHLTSYVHVKVQCCVHNQSRLLYLFYMLTVVLLLNVGLSCIVWLYS